MPKALHRVVALLLVQSLVVDPALASACPNLPLFHKTLPTSVFATQALAPTPASSLTPGPGMHAGQPQPMVHAFRSGPDLWKLVEPLPPVHGEAVPAFSRQPWVEELTAQFLPPGITPFYRFFGVNDAEQRI